MHTLIFDIDGTLIESMDFDSELYVEAAREVLGDVSIHADWASYEHVTDPGIFTQIMRENDIQPEARLLDEFRGRFGELIRAYLETHSCPAIPGAIDAFECLKHSREYTLGIATGGWGHTALMKLQAAGFSTQGVPVFSGDHHAERTAIMSACKEHLAPDGERAIYIGDREWDALAAKKLNWAFIGVGPHLACKTPSWIPDFTSRHWPCRAINAALES